MWFNNALIFNYKSDDQSSLAADLEEYSLKPCPPHARFIYGWLPAHADELVHEVAGAKLICMGKEERLLPRSVIKRVLEERVQQWEIHQGRSMKRAEKAQLAEELEFELLPKAFCVQKRSYALLDANRQRLIINSASSNQASQLTALLRKSSPGISIEPLAHADNLALHLTEWISIPTTLPDSFQLASDCLLFSPNDEKKRFNCKGYELPAEEILTLLSQGLKAAEISMIWHERIQFTLTHDLTLKRIKCLDYLVDEFNDIRQLEEGYEQEDAALTLLSGELRALIDDLLCILSPNSADKTKQKNQTSSEEERIHVKYPCLDDHNENLFSDSERKEQSPIG